MNEQTRTVNVDPRHAEQVVFDFCDSIGFAVKSEYTRAEVCELLTLLGYAVTPGVLAEFIRKKYVFDSQDVWDATSVYCLAAALESRRRWLPAPNPRFDAKKSGMRCRTGPVPLDHRRLPTGAVVRVARRHPARRRRRYHQPRRIVDRRRGRPVRRRLRQRPAQRIVHDRRRVAQRIGEPPIVPRRVVEHRPRRLSIDQPTNQVAVPVVHHRHDPAERVGRRLEQTRIVREGRDAPGRVGRRKSGFDRNGSILFFTAPPP